MLALPDYSPETYALILAIYLFAGTVKGAMGFGLPVVSVSLLPFLIPVETALAYNAITILMTNLQQIRAGGAPREGLSAAWPMMVGMAIMVPVGALFVVGMTTQTLMLILGGFVLLFVISSFFNPTLRLPDGYARPVGFGAGLLSGFVGALTSSPGPIFVMYVVSLHLARPVYMTALGFIMALFGVVVVASYSWVGILRWEHLTLGVICIVPAIVGMWLGDAWAKRLPVEMFRKIILALLGLIAILLIRRALG